MCEQGKMLKQLVSSRSQVIAHAESHEAAALTGTTVLASLLYECSSLVDGR